MSEAPKRIVACKLGNNRLFFYSDGEWRNADYEFAETSFVRGDIVAALVEALVAAPLDRTRPDWQQNERRISAALAAYDATLQAA